LVNYLVGDLVIQNGACLSEADLRELPAVISVRQEENSYSLAVSAPHITIPALLQRLQAGNQDLARLTTRHASLEDVFVDLTGRHLRDEESGPA
jgi:ABC-2 type transport system ATP-binding protein